MNRSKEISERIKEVFLNGLWVARTNFKEQLHKLSWDQAITRVGSLNSIASLTFHVNYYVAGVLHVLKGGRLEIHDKYSFDLPPIESEDDWKLLRESLFENAALFAASVENLDDEKLDEFFVDAKYGSYIRNIEAIIEHSYYHLGQIKLISKLLNHN